MLNIIETFSGIGSQVQALKNKKIDHKVTSIVEWEIGAMYAYDILHNGAQNLREYRHHTRESIVEKLGTYNLSGNGKEPLTERAIRNLHMSQLKAILHSIERNNNLVDIKSVTADQTPEADILTYSFPCQDLSVSGHWHNKTLGIDRDANNRSTLLWQIERILIEYDESNKQLPTFLLMENVSNILSSKHIGNFNEWQSFLESLGYYNQVYTLDARDFGVPQSRIRTYLVSVLAKDINERDRIDEYFLINNLSRNYKSYLENPIEKYLRLDYTNKVYRQEAIESTPNLTKSREKILNHNPVLAVGNKALNNEFARTVTTKQDRHPNSGIVKYDKDILVARNTEYRNLTPRECFLLMGFEESQFDELMEHNFDIGNGRKMLSQAKLIQLAGNSIVVPVLESIFDQMNIINDEILTQNINVESNAI